MQSSDDYRSVYCRLLDDSDFQALPPEAQRLWFFLRLSHECGPTGLFRWYPALTYSRMRTDETTMAPYLKELRRGNWVQIEDGYMLIRNAMRYEPTFRPAKNAKQLISVHRHLAALGHLRIAHELVDSLGIPYPQEWASKGYRKGIEGPSRTLGSPSTVPVLVPEPEPVPEPETVAVGTTATATNSEPEFPPEDQELTPSAKTARPSDDEDLPPNPHPEAVSNPDANAYPWDPEDEAEFGDHLKPHPRWQDYVEVHMALKTPAPWPRFMDWIHADSVRRPSVRQDFGGERAKA